MKTVITLLGLVLLLSSHPLAARSPATASQTIERFYRQYLNFKARVAPKKPVPKLEFSNGLTALIAKNKKLCDQKSQGEICGFGADGDIYLDAQDFDDELTFANSGFKLTEAKPGEVDVTFNVFPVSNPGDDPAKTKKILFKMIREKGRWVVDDIDYRDSSARKSIEAEIQSLK